MRIFGVQLFGRNDPAPVRAAMESYRRYHPRCEACGKTRVEIHHIIPVAVAPELAAEAYNLMSLCPACHLVLGHNGDYGRYVPNVREVVASMQIRRMNQ